MLCRIRFSWTTHLPCLGKLSECDESGFIAPGSALIIDQIQQFAVVNAPDVSNGRHPAGVHLSVHDQSTVMSENDPAQIFLNLFRIFWSHLRVASQGRKETKNAFAVRLMTYRTVLQVQSLTHWACMDRWGAQQQSGSCRTTKGRYWYSLLSNIYLISFFVKYTVDVSNTLIIN